jgi:serine/threonine-protein kinase
VSRLLERIDSASPFDDDTVVDFEADDTLVAACHGLPAPVSQGAMVGEYRIERKIAEGGMAAVYEAVHPVIGKRVAIKVLSPEQCSDPVGVERFVQEACAVNRIGHPNIVDVFSFGQLSDGRSYLVMEWLSGQSLAQRIAGRLMPIEDVVEVLDELADALQAAHDNDIAHRDLKPDNVFLVEGRCGRRSAKLLGDDAPAQRHTRAGMCVGTPGYMAPEQARGLDVDHRADVYSLGVLAFEMVTGRMPFDGDTDMAMVAKQLTFEAPAPAEYRPRIPKSINRLIRRMLEREPEYRPSLAEVRTALAKLQAVRLRPSTGTAAIVRAPESRPTPPCFLAVGTQPHAPSLERPAVARESTNTTLTCSAPRRRTLLLVLAVASVAALAVAVASSMA